MRGVVVVTGASAGVGRAVALEFARNGYAVAGLSRNQNRLDSLRGELEACGVSAYVESVDVSNSEQVEAAAENIERELGPIDIWVNDAMVSVFGEVKDISPSEFQRVTNVTYLGYVYGTLAALRRMKKRNKGTIVHVGSALAYQSIPLQSAYCGAKHAIQGFSDSLRIELKHNGSAIHVTSVHLPAINTPQFDWSRNKFAKKPQPVPPIFQPEVAARAIYAAAFLRRREVWVGSPTVKAIIAHKFAPRLAEWYLAKNGYRSQFTDEVEPSRADDLYSTVEGHNSSHGRFDNRAREYSYFSIADRHRAVIFSVSAGLAALAGWFAWKKKLQRKKIPSSST